MKKPRTIIRIGRQTLTFALPENPEATGGSKRGAKVMLEPYTVKSGMSMAANKVKGIRAAAVSDHFSAKYTRLHNNANILCLGGRVIGIGTALELADLFVDTEYEGGRHQKRIDMITDIEKSQ